MKLVVYLLLIPPFFSISLPLVSAELNPITQPRDSAISSDNKFIITQNIASNSLVILDAKNGRELQAIPVIDKKGNSSRVSAMHDASTRKSFIVALKDSPEVWEINYQNPPPAGFGTWVHDYRKESGEATVKLFPIRRLTLDTALGDFFFDESRVNVISVSCTGEIQIIDLDLGRRVAKLNIFGSFASGVEKQNIDNQLFKPYPLKSIEMRWNRFSMSKIP